MRLRCVRRMSPVMLIEEADGTVTEPVTPAYDDLSTYFRLPGSAAISEVRH
jgi:hypothetical protein